MEEYFKIESAKFGVTKEDLLEKTRSMVIEETKKVSAITTRLKNYMCDLDSVFAVFEA